MIRSVLMLAGFGLGLFSASAGVISPRYFGASPGALKETKSRLQAGDVALQPAFQALLKEADKALRATPVSVVEKNKVPPSGDKHDYMSLAPYFWPDPDKPDGLPYLRKDGKVNPESRDPDLDHLRVERMGKSVETLALAYYLTGKEVYAEKAARFLRTWFLDEATRMNPHLEYAQAIRGRNDGRGAGILEGRNLLLALDASGLLLGSPAWTAEEDEALKTWLGRYLEWLLTSKNGRSEASAPNNHGSHYDTQVVRLALILGREDLARKTVREAVSKRLAVQIGPDGRQPLELKRTKSLGYSIFNLQALFTLATLGEHVGEDLWHSQTPDERGLAKALDFLLPYLSNPPQKWPFEQIKEFDLEEAAPLLRKAAAAYGDPKYEKILSGYPEAAISRFQLLQPTGHVHVLPPHS
jgi:hypothetical protein